MVYGSSGAMLYLYSALSETSSASRCLKSANGGAELGSAAVARERPARHPLVMIMIELVRLTAAGGSHSQGERSSSIGLRHQPKMLCLWCCRFLL